MKTINTGFLNQLFFLPNLFTARGRASTPGGLFRFVCLGFSFCASVGLACADVDVQRDFAPGADGPKASLDGLVLWTGPMDKSFGDIALQAVPSEVSPSSKSALTFTTNVNNDVSPDGSKASPTLHIKTDGCGATGAKKIAVFQLRLLVPKDKPYRGDFYFGTGWDSNAAILIFSDNNINSMIESTPGKTASYTINPLGSYTTNTWEDLRVEFDCTAKTYSVYLNDSKIGNDLPWNDAKLSSVDSLTLAPGLGPVDKDGAPVFYLESFHIYEK